MEINARAAIVFGGASGPGEAPARRLHEAGAAIVIADLDDQRASAIAREPGIVPTSTDVTDPESVSQAVTLAAGRMPEGLRIAVVCAGISTPAKLIGRDGPTPLDRFASVINVNLLGTINALRLTAGAMLDNVPDGHGQRGVCIATASIAAYEGQVGQVAYAASKDGIAA